MHHSSRGLFRAATRVAAAVLIAAGCSGPASPMTSPGGTNVRGPGASGSGTGATPGSTTGGAVSPAAPACAPAGQGEPTAYAGWPAGPSGSEIVPILVSTELAVGPNRVLMTLVDANNQLIAAPGLGVTLRFFDLANDPSTPRHEAPGSFLWTLEGQQGLYRAQAAFDCAGDWGMEIVATEAGRPDRTARMVFPVRAATSTPAIGARAPASETPTATTREQVASISTDPSPDLDFYRASIRQAASSGKPFLVAFSTPAFCRTRTCGPALEIVKQAAAPFKERVTFIHVEPYQLQAQQGQLQPVVVNGQFQTVPSVTEWGLPTEPYIFVVDGAGMVRAKFEGVAGRDELESALQAVAG